MHTDILPFETEKKARLAKKASFILMGALGFAAMTTGLLPGLLAACAAFMMTRCLMSLNLGKAKLLPRNGLSAAVVVVAPLLAIVTLLFFARGYMFNAVGQYEALTEHLVNTVLRIREYLPEGLKKYLPEETLGVQKWLAGHLEEQASHIAFVGRSWLHGSLLAYVGIIVGALIAIKKHNPAAKVLSIELLHRARNLSETFKGIVLAQFWIASFNALMTAIFVHLILPQAGVQMPYATPLVGLTFALGMIPIVGNLMVNVVLTIVGGSVSPLVGLSCLLFLVLIHKTEYFINAKVVGSKTSTPVWELLAAMFIFETLFGVSGLVAAPLYYAYIKRELMAANLV